MVRNLSSKLSAELTDSKYFLFRINYKNLRIRKYVQLFYKVIQEDSISSDVIFNTASRNCKLWIHWAKMWMISPLENAITILQL